MELKDNERLDYVNDNLSLIQNKDGLTFGTDALLLAGFINKRGALGAELGAGSGIISLLLLSRGKLDICDCYEVQKEYAELTARNAKLNELDDRLNSFNMDIRDYVSGEIYDAVYTNPPYMKATSGYRNENESKNTARHEVCGDITDFVNTARLMLKYGGLFYAVYRCDRMPDLISAMRNCGIEPKRLTMVHADESSAPSMLLIEGKKGSKCGLFLTPPLILYADKSHTEYSEDMKFINSEGFFPDKFRKRR